MPILDTMLSSLPSIPTKTITKHFGLVSGSSVRSKHLEKDFFAGIKNMFGGELTTYTELLNESRNQAIQRMMTQAEVLGANAISNIRMATLSVAAGDSEISVYETAVYVK
ncbi:MAG: YbjQ family protein [Candidatus Absconditabacterales bacterium]|nr:YbjQ family protein [Candidatus Absconditabacterales bacterium]